MQTILVVDDEPAIQRFVTFNLRASGYRVLVAGTGQEALMFARREELAAILLDLMLPDLHGFEVCQQIRTFSDVPILMVTALGDGVDRVKGLDLGADDYIVKPFDVEELLARVRAVIRRAGPPESPPLAPLTVGPLTVDPGRHRVTLDGAEIHLTPTEFRLLEHLALRAGLVATHDELLTAVWGPEYRGATEYVRVTINRLRQKLEAEPGKPKLIVTVPGIGYKLEA